MTALTLTIESLSKDRARDRVGRRLREQDAVAMMSGREEEPGQRRRSDERRARRRRDARAEVAPRARRARPRRARASPRARRRGSPCTPAGGDLATMADVLHRRAADHATVAARNDVRVAFEEDCSTRAAVALRAGRAARAPGEREAGRRDAGNERRPAPRREDHSIGAIDLAAVERDARRSARPRSRATTRWCLR